MIYSIMPFKILPFLEEGSFIFGGTMKNKKILDYITKVAIFAALSIMLYFFPKFPLPFLFPSFLDVQFSNLPAILGGFVLGPVGGCAVVLIRTLVKLPFSSTMYVGELADFLIGFFTVLISSLVYRYSKTKKGGIIGLVLGTITWVVVAIIANGTFLINFYKEVAGIDAIIGMLESLFPTVNESNFMKIYLFGAVLPFNLMLASIVSLITFLVYKKISFLFKKDFIKKNERRKENENIDHI